MDYFIVTILFPCTRHSMKSHNFNEESFDYYVGNIGEAGKKNEIIFTKKNRSGKNLENTVNIFISVKLTKRWLDKRYEKRKDKN